MHRCAWPHAANARAILSLLVRCGWLGRCEGKSSVPVAGMSHIHRRQRPPGNTEGRSSMGAAGRATGDAAALVNQHGVVIFGEMIIAHRARMSDAMPWPHLASRPLNSAAGSSLRPAGRW